MVYRDELDAAQARIAELEKEVAELKSPRAGSDDRVLAELEGKYRDALAAAEPAAQRSGRAVFIGVILAPAILVALFVRPWPASLAVVAFASVLVAVLTPLAQRAVRRDTLAHVERSRKALSEARRVRALERVVHEHHLRVVTDDPAAKLEMDVDAPATGSHRSER